MPNYDYKCQSCGNRFSLFYKTYADYDSAHKSCPKCASDQLSRLITRVAIQQPTRDYGKMNSNEMLSVLQSGDSRQVGEMFNQIGGADPRLGAEYHETTQRLLKGESVEKVERDLQNNTPKTSD
ncbi:MAG: zinc ribbon domain-containing protein [Anaerolineae bacterium]|jgi:putative FmdB family regulatory protein|nr:zinc ribbon domain-containing protein [Anaerolineae bacterium]